MAKKYIRHRRRKRTNMKGGAFSQEESQTLSGRGFNAEQLETLQNLGVSFNDVMQKINIIMNQDQDGFQVNPDNMVEQVMIELMNEHIFENQPENVDSSFESQGTMTLDELNTSNVSSGYTTSEDSSGGKKRKIVSRKMRLKRKRGSKTRRYKQRGGTCYGTGVGSNNYDPNYSIYNTNMLKLFPYK